MSNLKELEWRGLIHDISDRDQVDKLPSGTPFYAGFDPTAPSLQVGNLVPLMALIHLGKAGLQPIVLFGGATGGIGDPSGKSEERTLLPPDVIEKNVNTQQAQVRSLLGNFGIEPLFVNNIDWTASITFLDFLRDVGKHLTVNYMISKEVVSSRLSTSGISFTEFSYMLLQAHDFLHLYQAHSCKLQLGGSDQWGNITAGLELIRKKARGAACAFSVPLITDSAGKKFGKSEGAAIWLDPALTSPYTFHQFFLNVPDSDVIRLLKVFTFLTEQEISELVESMAAHPERREAQKALADQLCKMVHGEEELEKAHASASVLFGGSFAGIREADLQEIFSQVPSSELPRHALENMSIIDVFVESGLLSSRGEAKKLIKNGGAYVNNERVTEVDSRVTHTDILSRNLFVLRSGKKSYHLVRIS